MSDDISWYQTISDNIWSYQIISSEETPSSEVRWCCGGWNCAHRHISQSLLLLLRWLSLFWSSDYQWLSWLCIAGKSDCASGNQRILFPYFLIWKNFPNFFSLQFLPLFVPNFPPKLCENLVLFLVLATPAAFPDFSDYFWSACLILAEKGS